MFLMSSFINQLFYHSLMIEENERAKIISRNLSKSSLSSYLTRQNISKTLLLTDHQKLSMWLISTFQISFEIRRHVGIALPLLTNTWIDNVKATCFFGTKHFLWTGRLSPTFSVYLHPAQRKEFFLLTRMTLEYHL